MKGAFIQNPRSELRIRRYRARWRPRKRRIHRSTAGRA